MEKLWQRESQKKCVNPNDLSKLCDAIREKKKSIATLNGSFDLLHAGHMQILYEASLQADCLIVCLNTDASIQSYKGKSRPIIPLSYRMQMMSALYFVDYVTWFDEDTPMEVLKKIRPNVHVNGSEYGKNCIESDLVASMKGKVHIVELIPGLSTSRIVEKIQTCG